MRRSRREVRNFERRGAFAKAASKASAAAAIGIAWSDMLDLRCSALHPLKEIHSK